MEKKENISVWKLILKCVLAVLGTFAVLALLIILPMWLMLSIDDWKHDRQMPQVRELAESYLVEQYPGRDFEITNAYHHWYDAAFYVEVQSESSADTHFTVTFDDDSLEFIFDTYKWDVLEGGNVRRRVMEEYNTAVQKILGAEFPELDMEADFFGAQGRPRTGDKPEAELDIVWELDKQYDLSVLGSQAGMVTVRFDNTEGQWPPERRMEVLCRIAKALEEADLDFFAVDVMVAEELYYGNPAYHFAQRLLKIELD